MTISTMERPNLESIIQPPDVYEKAGRKYCKWSRIAYYLNNHAKGWNFQLKLNSESPTSPSFFDAVWKAPDGTGYLMCYFAVDREHREAHGNMPLFPFPIMDNRNNPVPCEKISARVFTDSHRRALCACAAFTFGLAYELWAKEEIESLGAKPKTKPEIKTEQPKAKGDGEALTKQFLAFIKKNPGKEKLAALKTNLSDRFTDGSITD